MTSDLERHQPGPPEGLAPGSVAPGSVAPGSVAPGSVAPGGLAPTTPVAVGFAAGSPATDGLTAVGPTATSGLTPGGLTPGGLTPGGLTPGGFAPGGLTAVGLGAGDGRAGEGPEEVRPGSAVPTPLGELLAHVLEGEPAPAGEADEVFRRADRLRRRRTRLLLTAAAAILATVVLAGYLLTTTLLPARDAAGSLPTSSAGGLSAVPVPSTVADGVLAVIAPMVDGDHRRIEPRPPARGFGWRQYSVLAADGRPHGTVQVAVFARPGDFCFPRRDGGDGCAPADRAEGGVDYLRYGDGTDPDWQVNEAIARRGSDGRTVAVMATGERDATDPADAVPPLSNREVGQLATDQRLFDAFGPDESCDGPSAGACPVLKVPVPEAG